MNRMAGLFLAAALLAAPAPAPALPQRDSGTFIVRDFRFTSGETLPEVHLYYRTLGRPQRDAAGVVRNAVLILHGTGGTGAQFFSPLFTPLYRAGGPLDTSRAFVILPDDVGHGRSSKPSDSLRARFPHYGYQDMVTLEYRLVTEGLRVDHLRIVMGTSMGCMHSWLWAERYPAFMDGVVPLACIPTQIAGRNRMMRKLILEDIRSDPAWRGGDYTDQPPGLSAALQLLFVLTSSAPVQQRAAPTRDSADAWITSWLAARVAATDANDMLYQFDASRDYDPRPDLERITAPVLAINSADDFVNPPELGLMEQLIPRVPHARYVLVPISGVTRGHGTHTVAAAWEQWFAPFVAGLAPRPSR
jgi:homoserine O-acetyltransferase/O-succinyltransferase